MSTTMTRDRARRIDALFSRMVAAEEAIRRDFRDRAIIERRLAAARPDCPLLFYRLRKGKPVRIYEFRKAWASACKAVGLTGKLFHDFRRTGVRNLVRAGVPRKTAMAISGHRTEAVFERYNITDDANLVEAVDKLVAYVERLPSEPTIVVPMKPHRRQPRPPREAEARAC